MSLSTAKVLRRERRVCSLNGLDSIGTVALAIRGDGLSAITAECYL